MSTIAKGNAAEARVIAAMESAGIVTLIPFGGGCPFDVAVLLPDDRCALTEGRLRLEPTRNNQRLGVRMAEDYAFERWFASL